MSEELVKILDRRVDVPVGCEFNYEDKLGVIKLRVCEYECESQNVKGFLGFKYSMYSITRNVQSKCLNCYFRPTCTYDGCCTPKRLECSRLNRTDKKDVYFVRVDENE